ncbi:MAG: hypothetical protein COT84_07030 [Chlamydiae bacterium CG10_big_fil_rev_8_21_14_0_10_35_9]|nr:MAG: hypothetical protein COT84_07030 [Chlamydiae bacterium CG10_big_fil_rev_8_21_14_0_10_35_9]
MKIKNEINYIYFSCALIYVTLLSLSHILPLQSEYLPYKVFFSIYSALQALLEVSLFILVGFLFKKISPIAYKAYVGLLFLFLLAHYADYTVVKLMDTTILAALKIFFSSGIGHFFAAIHSLNLNLTMALLTIGTVIIIPFAGVVFYLITQKVIKSKPLNLSANQIGKIVVIAAFSLLTLDLFSRSLLPFEIHAKYQKTLPLKSTFLSPNGEKIVINKRLKTPILNKPLVASYNDKRPNIYLFIIETLRKDYITSEIAPNLLKLQENGPKIAMTFANANASHHSWFSIFTSMYPFHWDSYKSQKQGAIPLQLLKDLGYQIRVYTSADLKYFKMQDQIFGENQKIYDFFKDYTATGEPPPQRDLQAIKDFSKDLKNNSHATLFIIFLDSTHSEYSWHNDFTPKFHPIAKEIDYLTINPKKGLDKIKNRYKNSVNYIDHLIGRATDALKRENLYEEAILVFTGDHGEEFFENGALFHGTHLNNPQTTVPIIYKLNSNRATCSNVVTSHVDIFPTILNEIVGSNVLDTYFNGQSIFSKHRFNFALSMQQNGGEIPLEFFLHNGSHKIILKFPNTNLYQTSELEVLSLKDRDDKNIPLEKQNIIKLELEKGLSLIFD